MTTFESEMLRLGWRCSGFQYSPGCISLQSCSDLRGVCSLHNSFHIYGVTRKNTELQYWVDQQSLKITAGKNVIEKIQDCCHVNVLVYVFRYKHMFWWGFACVLHSSLKYSSLQMQRDTWSRAMGSFSSALKPSSAMSSCPRKVLHCSEHTLQSSVPVAFSRARGHSRVTGWFYPLSGALWSRGRGSAEAPREYLLCRLLCNITLKLVQFIFTFPMN